MNIAIALQRPSYKGKLNFDEETYLGVIAFGNALGNSIVSSIQSYENRQNLQKNITNLGKALNNANDKNFDAKMAQISAQQSINLTQVADKFNYSVGLQLDAKNNASLNRSDARSQYRADYGNYLTASADWNIQNLEYQTYNYRTSQGIERAQLSAAQQRRFEFGNARVAASFDALRPTGFNGNFTEAEWLATINNKTMGAWRSDLTNDVLDIVTLPLYAMGGASIARAGFNLAKVGYANLGRGVGLAQTAWNTTKGLGQIYGGYQVSTGGVNVVTDAIYSAANQSNSNRFSNQIENIYSESVQNGGLTLALGGTYGGDGFGIKADIAAGGWLSLDYNDLSLSGGGYFSGEVGGIKNFAYSTPSAAPGVEATVFTSPNFKDALEGFYGIGGAASSYGFTGVDVGRIKAAGGQINGYQFSYSGVTKPSSNYEFGLYGKFGYGNYFQAF